MLYKIVQQVERAYKYKVVFASIIGSTNYGLKTGCSDEDVLCWVIPNKMDIYNGYVVEKQHKKIVVSGKSYDLQLLDIRKWVNGLFSANPMYLEQLYVENYVMENEEFKTIVKGFQEYNWDKWKLYKGLKGLAYNHARWLNKGSIDLPLNSSGKQYVESYGINSKSLSNVYRMLYMIEEIVEGEEFKNLIYPEDSVKNKLLNLKVNSEELTEDDAKSLANDWIGKIDSYKGYFNTIRLSKNLLNKEKEKYNMEMYRWLLNNGII